MTYAQEDWFHVAHTPDGVHVHKMDHDKLASLAKDLLERGFCSMAETPASEAVAMATGMYAQAIRDELGFPEDWQHQAAYNSALAPGEPHSTLMAVATIHEDLPEVR